MLSSLFSYSLKLSVNEIEFLFTNSILVKKWNDVEWSCFFSCSLKDLKRHPCGINLWLFWTARTNYEKAPYTGVFLKFFPDSLHMERRWAFTFLGSLNPWDRNTDYTFMSFSASKDYLWKRNNNGVSFKVFSNSLNMKRFPSDLVFSRS